MYGLITRGFQKDIGQDQGMVCVYALLLSVVPKQLLVRAPGIGLLTLNFGTYIYVKKRCVVDLKKMGTVEFQQLTNGKFNKPEI